MARKWKSKGSLWTQPSLSNALFGIGSSRKKSKTVKQGGRSYKMGDYRYVQPPLMTSVAANRVQSRHRDRLRRVS